MIYPPSENDGPPVSVIVPVKDDWDRLSLCLDKLLAQNYPGGMEIIVVDDGSTMPCPPGVSHEERITVVPGPRRGSYAARNAGLERASHDVLAFTDADCLARPGWLRAGVNELAIAGEGLAIVAGSVALFLPPDSKPTAAGAYDLVYGIRQATFVEQGFAATANLFTTRSTIEHCGPFDANLESGGDKEWCLRARSKGAVIHYAKEAVVEHPTRNSVNEIEAKFSRVTRGRLQRIANEPRRLPKIFLLLLPPPQPWLFAVGSHRFGLRVRAAVFFMGFRLWWARIRIVLAAGAARRQAPG